ncbi:hypothetical protein ACVBEQ_21680 [Nakamurella sp. GG22]
MLREFVDGRLAKRHSPDQISHELTVQFPDSLAPHLAVETLYQAVYQPERDGLTAPPRRVCAAAGGVVDRCATSAAGPATCCPR